MRPMPLLSINHLFALLFSFGPALAGRGFAPKETKNQD